MKNIFKLISVLTVMFMFAFSGCDNIMAPTETDKNTIDSLLFVWDSLYLEVSGGTPDSVWTRNGTSVGYNFTDMNFTKCRIQFDLIIFNPYDKNGKTYILLLDVDHTSPSLIYEEFLGNQILHYNNIFQFNPAENGNYQFAIGIMDFPEPMTYQFPHRKVVITNVRLYKVF